MFELFEKHAVLGDFASAMAIGEHETPSPIGKRSPMPRQTNNANVVTEIFAAELRSDAEILGERENFFLKLAVAERTRVGAAHWRQRIVVGASMRA